MADINDIVFSVSDYPVSNPRNSSTLYLGKIESNWGFFLVESLSRLWYYIEHQKIHSFAYLAPEDADVENIFGMHTNRILEVFSLLGIQINQLRRITEDEIENCIVPGESFHHLEMPTLGKKTANAYLEYLGKEVGGVPAYYFTDKYKTIYSTIRDNCICDLPVYEKIYFSRARLKKKKEIGEKHLERVFAENGFKVLYPEQLPPSAQIWYVKNCKVLASVEGTLAHNSLFASDGMKQIVLRKQSEIIPRQYMINQAIGVETSYIKCFKEPFKSFPISHSKGPFLLWASDELQEFCADNGYRFFLPHLWSRLACFIEYTFKCIQFKVEKMLKRIVQKDRI